MKFRLGRSFPVPVSRLWEVVVEEYADAATWDRSVHSGKPMPDSEQVNDIEHSVWVWETTFGQLTVQILEARRDGDGGIMAYTIVEGLPGIVRDGRSTWTISSDGPDKATTWGRQFDSAPGHQ